MTSSDWNSRNVYLKYTNFCVYMFFTNFGRFRKITYTQNFLLNSIRENKCTLKMHKIHTSQNARKKICKINSAKFWESINNRSILNQYKSWPACFSVDLDKNISRISFNSAVFSLGLKFRNSKFSKTCHSQK